MEIIALSIGIAGVAHAIALSLKYYFDSKADRCRAHAMKDAISEFVSKNETRLFNTIEQSIKSEIIQKMGRLNVKDTRADSF